MHKNEINTVKHACVNTTVQFNLRIWTNTGVFLLSAEPSHTAARDQWATETLHSPVENTVRSYPCLFAATAALCLCGFPVFGYSLNCRPFPFDSLCKFCWVFTVFQVPENLLITSTKEIMFSPCPLVCWTEATESMGQFLITFFIPGVNPGSWWNNLTEVCAFLSDRSSLLY